MNKFDRFDQKWSPVAHIILVLLVCAFAIALALH